MEINGEVRWLADFCTQPSFLMFPHLLKFGNNGQILLFLILQSAWRVLIQHFWFLNYTFPSPEGVFMVLFEV